MPPPDVAGTVELRELLDPRSREILEDPASILRPASEVDMNWARPRVRAKSRAERLRIMEMFLKFRIAEPVHSSQVLKSNGQRVVNGVFGVVKAKGQKVRRHEGAKEKWQLRTICHFVSSHSCQRDLPLGRIDVLPSPQQFDMVSLLHWEQLVISQRDRQCFFYIFCLPAGWPALFGFSEPIPESWAPQELRQAHRGAPGGWLLGCRVAGMGWKYATAVCEAAHRAMLLRGSLLPKGMSCQEMEALPQRSWVDASKEIRKDKSFPMAQRRDQLEAWSVYIDNLDVLEIMSGEEAQALKGTTAEVVRACDSAYEYWKAPGQARDHVDRQTLVPSLGVVTDGERGVRWIPGQAVREIISLALFLCTAPRGRRRWLQVLAGRLVRIAVRNRALFIVLAHTWQWIQAGRWGHELPLRVVSEIMSMCVLLPLSITSMRLSCSAVVSATDASEEGGGICTGSVLSTAGRCFAEQLRCPLTAPSHERLGLLSLFDGVGGLRMAFESIGVIPGCYISVEKCPKRARVVSRAWPDVVHCSDIKSVDADMVMRWRNMFPYVRELVVGGGFPCQDLSSLNVWGLGVQGRNSSLVLELIGVLKLVRNHWKEVRAWPFRENVASAKKVEICKVNKIFGIVPVLADASEVTWVRRKRYYWVGWRVHECGEARLEREEHCFRVRFTAGRGPTSEWLQRSSSWQGEGSGRPLPTMVRWLPAKSPRPMVHGLEGASSRALRLWRRCWHACAVYHFEAKNLITDRHKRLRLPLVNEREALHGYKREHTVSGMKSAEAKSQPFAECRTRCSMIGDGFSVPVVAWLMSWLMLELKVFTRVPLFSEIRKRDCAACHSVDIVTHPGEGRSRASEFGEEERVCRWLMSQGSSRGSDVRVTTGAATTPNLPKRQPIMSELWIWRKCVSWKWKSKAHINELELMAAYNEMRRRSRSSVNHRSCYVHLLDNEVSISVLSKGRSSSRRLNRVLRRANSLIWATGMKPCFCFVRSAANPADAPSREGAVRKDGKVKQRRDMLAAEAAPERNGESFVASGDPSAEAALCLCCGLPLHFSPDDLRTVVQ